VGALLGDFPVQFLLSLFHSTTEITEPVCLVAGDVKGNVISLWCGESGLSFCSLKRKNSIVSFSSQGRDGVLQRNFRKNFFSVNFFTKLHYKFHLHYKELNLQLLEMCLVVPDHLGWFGDRIFV